MLSTVKRGFLLHATGSPSQNDTFTPNPALAEPERKHVINGL
ncbi:hypothetical protein ACBQ16_09115 [Halopseudomonas bauzanensis]|nr:hypothetical protein [Halopseudomonas bauzanensis]